MLELIKVDNLKDLDDQRDRYKKELLYAQDLNIEENIRESQYYKIYKDSAWIGYVCIDLAKTIWEFYLIEDARIYAQEIFRSFIDMNYIIAAECKTYDSLFLSLCFDYHKKAEGSAYLFRDYADTSYPTELYDLITYRLAAEQDYDSLAELDKIADEVGFFHDLRSEIKNQEVFVFFCNNQLIGSGTCKHIWLNSDYRDIGMVVAKDHRRKGIGTYILIRMKEYCLSNGLIPVCGCWYYNHSSKLTLEKAGFLAKHRVIRFQFN